MNTSYNTQTDEELVLLIQQGLEEPFGVLMDRYTQKLLRYGKKFISSPDNIEDIVQEVFIKVYKNIQSFDTKLKFSPWIYRIAHNSFINCLRKMDKEPLLVFDFDTLLNHPIYEDPTIKEKENEEIRVLLNKGLEQLKPNYREILVLYYFEELNYQEIADVLHVPTGTVSIRLKRAREILKKHIPYE
jgi:RNA polymerase sigma-70 factor (ECF subfamily)